MKVWIDHQDGGRDSIEVEVDAVPRIGEMVGAWHPPGMEDTDVFILDFVVDVRHYVVTPTEIRVLVSARR